MHDPSILQLRRRVVPTSTQLGADVIAASAALAARTPPKFVDESGNKYYARDPDRGDLVKSPGRVYLMRRYTGRRWPPGPQAARFEVPISGARIRLVDVANRTAVVGRFGSILAGPKSYGHRASRRHQPRALLVRLHR